MTRLFNQLAGFAPKSSFHRLLVAPRTVRSGLIQRIRREEDAARAGKEAWIKIKVNSIVDEKTIDALYRASQAGVKIDIVERGICALKPGVPGLSENITVRSIVGNFLEHARIFYFYNDGFEDVYMGSADWMPRNLDKRVEITLPVEDEDLKKRVIEIMEIQLSDTLKAHIMQPDGSYAKQDLRGREMLEAQNYFCKQAMGSLKEDDKKKVSRIFIPRKKIGD